MARFGYESTAVKAARAHVRALLRAFVRAFVRALVRALVRARRPILPT